MRGTARWNIAAADASNAPLNRYACALGIQLDARLAPKLERLLSRVGTGPMIDPVKQHYAVPRPFVGTQATICETRTLHLASNGDYPSGHAANGWLEALILAELVPDRASAILARGRAYGESRAVCGSHTISAVEAGWVAGSSMFAALNGTPAFQRDLIAASREVRVLRRSAPKPDANRCAAEVAALSTRAW